MKLTEATQVVRTCLEANQPVLLAGPPGVGKTASVEQACVDLGYEYVPEYAATLDPCDYRGQPAVVGDQAEFLPYGNLRRLLAADRPMVVCFDDLGTAPASVQASVMNVLSARRIAAGPISKHVRFAATTNRRQDRAGVSQLISPLIGRFAAVCEIEPDCEGWVKWAMTHGISVDIIGFLRFRPQQFFVAPSGEALKQPSPRSWTQLSHLLAASAQNGETVARAVVGESAAAEFSAYRAVVSNLPTWESIVARPEKVAIPKTAGAAYALAALAAVRTTRETVDEASKFVMRLGEEYAGLWCGDVLSGHPEVAGCAEYIRLAKKLSVVLGAA